MSEVISINIQSKIVSETVEDVGKYLKKDGEEQCINNLVFEKEKKRNENEKER